MSSGFYGSGSGPIRMCRKGYRPSLLLSNHVSHHQEPRDDPDQCSISPNRPGSIPPSSRSRSSCQVCSPSSSCSCSRRAAAASRPRRVPCDRNRDDAGHGHDRHRREANPTPAATTVQPSHQTPATRRSPTTTAVPGGAAAARGRRAAGEAGAEGDAGRDLQIDVLQRQLHLQHAVHERRQLRRIRLVVVGDGRRARRLMGRLDGRRGGRRVRLGGAGHVHPRHRRGCRRDGSRRGGSPPPRVANTSTSTMANRPDMKIAVATTAGWNLVGSG